VRISHIFPHKLAFSTAIFKILFVFLLPISVRFRYLDQLLANRMAPSCVRTTVEPDGVVGFKQFCTIIFPHISAAYLAFVRSAYFLVKMPHKTDMPTQKDVPLLSQLPEFS